MMMQGSWKLLGSHDIDLLKNPKKALSWCLSRIAAPDIIFADGGDIRVQLCG